MRHTFIETDTVKRIDLAVQRAMDWEYPSLIIGEPGNGKTTSLLHLAAKYGGHYFEVDEGTVQPPGMYKKLISLLVGYRIGKTVYDDIEQLVRLYTGSERDRTTIAPLFVDEQQMLLPKTLRELLRICERCNMPLILAGNQERLVLEGKRDVSALDQIRSRIGHRVQVGPPTHADCDLIAATYNVEGLDAYKAVAAFGARTNLRELVRVLQEARALTDGSSGINLRHVELAVMTIYGDRENLKLLEKADG